MSQFLEFKLNVNDPETTFVSVIISESPYIEELFIQIPLYDKFNVKIGYEAGTTYIQQVDKEKYSIRVFTTYNFYTNNSSINWQYNFLSDSSSYRYPLNKPLTSNIVSTTGDYYGKSGVVSVKAYASGLGEVTVGFNFN